MGREERERGEVVDRMAALGRERSGIEWRELKVITLIFTTGTVAPTAKMRLQASCRCTRAFERESRVCSVSTKERGRRRRDAECRGRVVVR